MSEQNGFAPRAFSAGVAAVRGCLCLKRKATQEIPLRSILTGTRWGSSNGGWWGLKDDLSGSIAGEACFGRIMKGSRRDPLQAYTCVRLFSGPFLESVEYVSAPKVAFFFSEGLLFGCMAEERGEFPKSASWWQRFGDGRRMWRVFLYDTMIGHVELHYPLDRKTRLLLQLSGGVSLPIGLASVGGRKSTRFVIPPDTPIVPDHDLEVLHFLLVIVFRSLFPLDFSG